jgi:hypothetical protein
VELSPAAPLSERAIDPLPIWEITSVIISCLIAEWIVAAFANYSKIIGAIPVAFAFALIIFSHHEREETAADIGFRFDNFWPAVKLLFWPTILVVIAILSVGWWLRGNEFRLAPLRLRFIGLPLWALFQQYALQGFINRRAQLRFGPGSKSILLVAIIFSLVHLPNPLLMMLTLIGGLLWATVYQRAPNLFALALSHALASLVVTLSLSPSLVNGLRVGLKYFR